MSAPNNCANCSTNAQGETCERGRDVHTLRALLELAFELDELLLQFGKLLSQGFDFAFQSCEAFVFGAHFKHGGFGAWFSRRLFDVNFAGK